MEHLEKGDLFPKRSQTAQRGTRLNRQWVGVPFSEIRAMPSYVTSFVASANFALPWFFVVNQSPTPLLFGLSLLELWW